MSLRHMSAPVAAVLAVVVGSLVALQSRINGQLAVKLDGDGTWAAVISFGTGLVMLAFVMLFSPAGRHAFAELPALVRQRLLRPWELFGGLGGATVVASQGIVVPHTGVAPYTIAIVAGQTSNSVAVDALGLAPGGKRPLTWERVTAAVMTIVAVGLAVAGRSSGSQVTWALMLLPLLAGALIAFQQAFNSKIGVVSGSPLAATFLNFCVGTGVLVAAMGIEHLIKGKPIASPPNPLHDPGIYLGGPIGALFIGLSVVAVAPLGVLLFGLASICGQLVGALLLDLFAPTAGAHVGWQTIVAIVVTALATTITAVAGRRRQLAAAAT